MNEKYLNLIAKGESKVVLKLLNEKKKYLPKSIQRSAIQLNARFEGLQNEINQGVISNEERLLRENQINLAILNLLEKFDLDKNNELKSGRIEINRNRLFITIFSFVIIGVFSLYFILENYKHKTLYDSIVSELKQSDTLLLNPKSPNLFKSIQHKFLEDSIDNAIHNFSYLNIDNNTDIVATVNRGSTFNYLDSIVRTLNANMFIVNAAGNEGDIRATLPEYSSIFEDTSTIVGVGSVKNSIANIQYENAMEHRQLLKIIPDDYNSNDNVYILFKKGLTNLINKDFLEANFYFTEVITEFPNIIKLNLLYGICKRNIGDYQKAIQVYDKIIYQDSKVYQAYLNKAVVQLELGQPDKALQNCITANKMQPNESIVLATLGQSYLMLSNYDEAIYYFEKSLNIDVYNSNALHGKAYTNLMLCGLPIDESVCEDWRLALKLGVGEAKLFLEKYCQSL